ncbi:GreA/GreB family elongation factor [Pedobacter insulae]|uniref:Regulator of nucleoside diphosphate kinase n=1 Tax=Pedobacter insulae TaxID=414048 RepID=A0A1I2WS66_9SPHI|nr:GreA/GreB family elongation factor [Pedobacter insulae]SFH03459.1 regulator of nucleoside diphosphate kinase [Pedobacter insulae]
MNTKAIQLSKSDYKFLSEHFEKAIMSDYNKSRLRTEIKTAVIYEDHQLPIDVVSLNKEATIISTADGKELNFKIVKPSEANMTEKKVSIFAPISIALLGYKTGDLINWEMPDGIKEFKIVEVK